MMQREIRGFTLVELVITMILMGIVGSMLVTVVQSPINAYFEAQRRAQLSNTADIALRSLAREVRTALPNSIRVSAVGSTVYLEYIATSGGGRYRSKMASSGLSDPLDFTAADTGFDVLGLLPAIPSGASIAVMNLGGGTGSDAYAGNNLAANASASGGKITFSSFLFPFDSPAARFFVVSGPVTYACNPSSGILSKYSGYALALTQPTPPLGGSASLVVGNVSACSINYDTISGRTGSLAISLTVSSSAGESIRLFNQISIANSP